MPLIRPRDSFFKILILFAEGQWVSVTLKPVNAQYSTCPCDRILGSYAVWDKFVPTFRKNLPPPYAR